MRTSALEIDKQKKDELRRLLRDLKRLNIHVVSSDGKVVTNVQEIVRIAKAQSNAASAKQRKTSKRSVPTQQSKTRQTMSWHFSNHVFPGVETQTFSRQEIYEDAEWEKNLH